MKKYTHITKEDVVRSLEKHQNEKKKVIEELGITYSWLRDHILLWGIPLPDNRQISNNLRKISVPPKEELENLYIKQNLTFVAIGKIYNTSNVTVKKWYEFYKIPLLSHSETIKQKVTPKIQEHNLKTYGNKDFFASEEGKESVKQGLIKKYGVPFYPSKNTSKAELEILEFVNSLTNNSFSKTHFNNIEIDMYSEDFKLGIEYCGIFWHSEAVKGKDLHVKKYKICKENGIRLLTIFEDEWLNRKQQVKAFIKSILKANTNKIYARQCEIKKLHPRDLDANKFLEENHIQSKTNIVNVINHYALVFNDDIVAIMTISKHHRNNEELVLSRFCVKNDYSIAGGASKLFLQVKNDFKGCLLKTWSDNRWSEGNLYNVLGFALKTEYPKDYSYVKQKQRISKQSMTKKKIQAAENQTEYERAKELGYERIWDCGKKLWTIQL